MLVENSFQKLPLSLCIVTLNEEDNIQRCIKSVPFASEIIVLDSGSSDQTKTLALELGARFFEEPWRGFGLQKQRAVALSNFDWVLCLDADEELSDDLKQEIYEIARNNFNASTNASTNTSANSSTMANTQSSFKTHSSVEGFRFPRRSFYLGQWLYFGGWYPDYQKRLFNRTKINWSEETLHESVQGGVITTLKSNLNHYPFANLSDQVLTNNRYSTLGADRIINSRKKIRFWQLIIKPLIKFIELYVIKMGFRDGIPGYIVAIGGAYSYFLRFAKAWERQRNPLE